MLGGQGRYGATTAQIQPIKNNSPSLFSIDGIALAAVFLQATELFRPFGYLIGLRSSYDTNLVFLIFFASYLVIRNKLLLKINGGVLLGWIFILVLAPPLIMSLQLFDGSVTPDRIAYWTVFSLMFALLLLVVVVLWSLWGPKLTLPFFLACIGAAWLGFAVNWIDYEFLRRVMDFGSIPAYLSANTVRAIGFYPHPNVAAFSLVVYFAVLACDNRFLSGSYLVQTAASMSCLLGVLVTGSRTSLFLLTVSLFWFLYQLLHFNGGSPSRNRARSLVAPLIPLAVLAASLLMIQVIAGSRQDLARMVAARTGSISEILGGGGNDASTSYRLSMLSAYYDDFFESPLIGLGPDYATSQIAEGHYIAVSQNAWLEWGVAFGAPYAVGVALLLFCTYRALAARFRNLPLALSSLRLIMVLFILITFSMVNPFWMRAPVCVLGVLIGVAVYVAKGGYLEQEDSHSGRGLHSVGEST